MSNKTKTKKPSPLFWKQWCVYVKQWQGERNRPLALYRPCTCGCSPFWYLSSSNKDGFGITIRLTDEEAHQILSALDPEEPTCQPQPHQIQKQTKKRVIP